MNHLKESDRTNELNATIEELRTKYETLREEQMELSKKKKYILKFNNYFKRIVFHCLILKRRSTLFRARQIKVR